MVISLSGLHSRHSRFSGRLRTYASATSKFHTVFWIATHYLSKNLLGFILLLFSMELNANKHITLFVCIENMNDHFPNSPYSPTGKPRQLLIVYFHYFPRLANLAADGPRHIEDRKVVRYQFNDNIMQNVSIFVFPGTIGTSIGLWACFMFTNHACSCFQRNNISI